MPILNVEIVLHPNETPDANLAQKIADEAGRIFSSPRGGTCVKLQFIPDGQYAENGAVADVYPVFVSVLKSKMPSAIELQSEVEQLTTLMAKICNRPANNVHIIYLPEAKGRIAFGGKIIGK